jgi:hypothetical protein
MPKGSKKINVRKLHHELESAGIPIVGVDSDGRVSYASAPSGKQEKLARTLVDAHDPAEEPSPAPSENSHGKPGS